jgi:hypothetical protein
MSLKHVDIQSAMRRLADKRIEEAMAAGKFDNLAGMGKQLELGPMPADENARLMWWSLRILRNNDIIPEEVRWRKMIDQLKAQLAQIHDETRVKSLVSQINEIVHRLNTLGTNALKSAIVPIDLEVELRRFKQ